MCGITGFTGKQPALPFLLQGLSKLEYRGYDSAGVTLVNSRKLKTWKTKGRLSELEKKLPNDLTQSCGIGHTRWATHGVPSNMNAHPHMNSDNSISVVHNGAGHEGSADAHRKTAGRILCPLCDIHL